MGGQEEEPGLDSGGTAKPQEASDQGRRAVSGVWGLELRARTLAGLPCLPALT